MIDRQKWRVWVILGLYLLVAGVISFRLLEKQVLEHDEYSAAAAKQSVKTTTDPADRGRIFSVDKDGNKYPLAVGQWTYELQVSPRQVKDKKALSEKLATLVPEIGSASAIFDLINNDKVYVPPLIKGLSEDKATEVTNKKLGGVFLKANLTRTYPEADKLAAQIVGFVGGDGEGKYGVEGYYNQELSGIKGIQKQKKDSLGRLIDVLSKDQPITGGDIIMSIDNNVQYTVEQKLKAAKEKYQADSGSIIVMRPDNGEIVAMAGDPTYDPNNYSKIPSDQQRVYLAPAVSDQYEPGSVVKPITMAMALDMDLVQPETTSVFGKSVKVLDHEIFNAENKVYGKETMAQVLENSDNIAMVWISRLLGKENMRNYFEKFGIGKKLGIDLIGEQAGELPELKNWNDLMWATASFGQGISMTPVQLASAYCTLANGGTSVTPHVAKKVVYPNKEETLEFPKGTQIIKPETSQKIKDMLVGVVVRGHGKNAAVEGIQVAGKTGTAQVLDPTTRLYSETQHVGTFAGFFPAEKPQYVMVVRLNNPKNVKYAESSAAPTFGEIAQWMVNYYGIK